jgi:single-strand DNA-binding protein
MNKAILCGNIGKDPIVKDVAGRSLIEFTIATTDQYKNKDGEKKTITDWHNVKVWGKPFLANVLKKGMKVIVEGAIKSDRYEKEGTTKMFFYINADNIELVSRGAHEDAARVKQEQEDYFDDNEEDPLNDSVF